MAIWARLYLAVADLDLGKASFHSLGCVSQN